MNLPVPDQRDKVSLIILTLNEIQAVRTIFASIPFQEVDETFVVDGGSTDGTVGFFEERGIPVYIQPKPGHGEAYKYGMQKASYETLVFFSGDGNEKPADIPRMVAKMREGYDLVIASRFGYGEKSYDVTPVRLLGNYFFTFLVNFRFGIKLKDIFNAFRGLRKESMRKMDLQESFFQSELEMGMKACHMGMRIGDFSTVEQARCGGVEKLQTVRDGFDNLKCFFKYWNPPRLQRHHSHVQAVARDAK